MEEILITRWYGKYPIIYRVSYTIPGGWECDFFREQYCLPSTVTNISPYRPATSESMLLRNFPRGPWKQKTLRSWPPRGAGKKNRWQLDTPKPHIPTILRVGGICFFVVLEGTSGDFQVERPIGRNVLHRQEVVVDDLPWCADKKECDCFKTKNIGSRHVVFFCLSNGYIMMSSKKR